MLNDTYAVTDLNVLNVDTYHKIRSVERLFYKTPRRRFRSQWFFSVFYYHYFFFLLLLFSFIIVILNYCKMDYKVYIIRNNKLIYLSRMKSCLWGLLCYHYSLAQRPISHRIHMFHATLSIICKCRMSGIGCVSIWCASGRGFLFHASATYRSLSTGALAWSSNHTYRYVRMHARTQANARTYSLLPWHSNKNKSRCTVTAHTK